MSRIDVHNHVVPRVFVDAVAERAPGWSQVRLPEWSPQTALAMIYAHDVGDGVLSLSTPGTHVGDDAAARDLARRVNETTAEVVEDRPDGIAELLGSNPITPAGHTEEEILDELGGFFFDTAVRVSIDRGAAETLFPRLTERGLSDEQGGSYAAEARP